jgi:hypothetical protein
MDRAARASRSAAGTVNRNVDMRRTFALALLLLAGCASTQPEPPQRRPVITRLPAAEQSDDTTYVSKVEQVSIEVTTGFCQTGDRMPTARNGALDQPGASIPTAPALGALPYIPNACPVTAGPLARRSVVVTYPKERP